MGEKRDGNPIGVRLTPQEERWLRRQAASLDLDVAVVIRKALAIGVPVLLSSAYVCKVADLKDVITNEKCM
ncbi:MAG: hypothetical protein LBR94_05740 [Desulfovibrio sp.]|jgi:hypothetical protein|nr:hypothetical protein [Desulfovibrio sp.]